MKKSLAQPILAPQPLPTAQPSDILKFPTPRKAPTLPSLPIQTFINPPTAGTQTPGPQALFKALGHPLAAEKLPALLQKLQASPSIALYDPLGQAETFAAFANLKSLKITECYTRPIERLGQKLCGKPLKPASQLAKTKAKTLFITAFDTPRLLEQLGPTLPKNINIVTLDDLRLPSEMLTDTRTYLNPINFATNFGWLRAEGTQHNTIVGFNYWSTYGAREPKLWLRLIDANGQTLQTWTENLGPAGSCYRLSSLEIRKRFNLPEFNGTLFMHAINIAGHDIVKYVVDFENADSSTLTCTHDANAWPSDQFAGLPAPNDNEKVILWLQNSHPLTIPANSIGLSLMGDKKIAKYPKPIPPFATVPLNVATLLPKAKWPQQFEFHAGRYFVRPRYEVITQDGPTTRQRIAHVNVVRADLHLNPNLPQDIKHLGKAYIMPLPVLPITDYTTIALPTPMANAEADLPLSVTLFDSTGQKVASQFLGRLKRNKIPELNVNEWIKSKKLKLPSGMGHIEFTYDFRQGGSGTGWLHAIGRYQHTSGHAAETSFGAHIFNVPDTYKGEPQSYAGPPPGLTTRIVLRLGTAGEIAYCHLIYPCSGQWHAHSTTELTLHTAQAEKLASHTLHIPQNGSKLWSAQEFFSPELLQKAQGGYVQITDKTCRLFGYHGLKRETNQAFSLDHMFGF